MHRVAPDQQLILAGGDQVGRMARRVAVRRDRGDPGEHLAVLEQAPAVAVRLGLFASGLEVELAPALVRFGHGAVVEPVLRLVLVHDELRIREIALPRRHVDQAGGMVGVHVGQQHGVDARRRDPGRCQPFQQPAAGGRQIVAAAGIDQGGAPARPHDEAVHRCAAAWHRPERLRQDLMALVLGDVLQHFERAVEIAVADRRHGDVPDAPMIDTGNLLAWRLGHALVPRLLVAAMLSPAARLANLGTGEEHATVSTVRTAPTMRDGPRNDQGLG